MTSEASHEKKRPHTKDGVGWGSGGVLAAGIVRVAVSVRDGGGGAAQVVSRPGAGNDDRCRHAVDGVAAEVRGREGSERSGGRGWHGGRGGHG